MVIGDTEGQGMWNQWGCLKTESNMNLEFTF